MAFVATVEIRYNASMLSSRGNLLQSEFLRDRLILVSLTSGAVLNIIIWILAISKFGYTQETVPLHYSVVYGIDFVSSSRQIYQLPAAGLVIWLVNAWLGRMVFQEGKIFSYFLIVGSVFGQLILLLALLTLVILNS